MRLSWVATITLGSERAMAMMAIMLMMMVVVVVVVLVVHDVSILLMRACPILVREVRNVTLLVGM